MDYKSFIKVQLNIVGTNFTSLFAELQKQNVVFEAQKISDTELSLKTRANFLPIIFALLQKKCYTYTITRKSGVNSASLIGALCAVLILFCVFVFLSNMCFGVQVIADKDLKQKVLNVLDENNLNQTLSWGSLDFSQIENLLLQNIPELSLVNVSQKGAFMLINTNEATLPNKIETSEKNIKGIFATQNGVVSRIFVASGTALVKVGDSVSFGQMLVAPFILNAESEQVEAEVIADVYLFLWDSVTIEFKENSYEYVRTGNFVEDQKLVFGNDILSNRETNCEYETFEAETFYTDVSNVLPVRLCTTRYYETTPVPVQKEFEAEKEALIYQAKQNLLNQVDETKILEEKYTISQVDEVYFVTYYTKREVKV